MARESDRSEETREQLTGIFWDLSHAGHTSGYRFVTHKVTSTMNKRGHTVCNRCITSSHIGTNVSALKLFIWIRHLITLCYVCVCVLSVLAELTISKRVGEDVLVVFTIKLHICDCCEPSPSGHLKRSDARARLSGITVMHDTRIYRQIISKFT